MKHLYFILASRCCVTQVHCDKQTCNAGNGFHECPTAKTNELLELSYSNSIGEYSAFCFATGVFTIWLKVTLHNCLIWLVLLMLFLNGWHVEKSISYLDFNTKNTQSKSVKLILVRDVFGTLRGSYWWKYRIFSGFLVFPRFICSNVFGKSTNVIIVERWRIRLKILTSLSFLSHRGVVITWVLY